MPKTKKAKALGGRPKLDPRKAKRTLVGAMVPPETLAWIDAGRGSVSRSRYVADLLDELRAADPTWTKARARHHLGRARRELEERAQEARARNREYREREA